jgi:hypothetical protein
MMSRVIHYGLARAGDICVPDNLLDNQGHPFSLFRLIAFIPVFTMVAGSLEVQSLWSYSAIIDFFILGVPIAMVTFWRFCLGPKTHSLDPFFVEAYNGKKNACHDRKTLER